MAKIGWMVLMLAALILAGCGRKRPPVPQEPLTVEEWKSMPAEEKFEFATIERLKAGTPKFQDDGEWDKFARAVFIPARKRELLDGAPGK